MSEGQKFSSNKAQERAHKQRARNVRRGLVALGAVSIVALVVWGALALTSSPLFNVRTVVVTGNSAVPAADIQSAVATDVATTVFKVDPDEVLASLKPLPWIATVTVKKRLPSTVEIIVTERVARATVSTTDKAVWVLSEDGVWLGTSAGGNTTVADPRGLFLPIACDIGALVEIRDVPEPDVSVGRRTASPEVKNAVKILDGLSKELLAQVHVVSAPEVGNTIIYTDAGVEIVIGVADDMAVKDKIITSILNAHEGKVSLINVRSVESPTWRGVK